jgi:hypothetical protein
MAKFLRIPHLISSLFLGCKLAVGLRVHMSNFAPCHTEPKPTPHGLAALHWCNSIDLLGVALGDGTVTAYRWNEMDGSKKDWKRMWSHSPENALHPGSNTAAGTASRLLLWQPDGRAAAIVSSACIEVLNVESGVEIFHATLGDGLVPVHRVVDGVWAPLCAPTDGSAAADDRELNFTDFLPGIPRFSEGSGSANGEENDDAADLVSGDFAHASSASSTSSPTSKPSLSLIAVVDARGRIKYVTDINSSKHGPVH